MRFDAVFFQQSFCRQIWRWAVSGGVSVSDWSCFTQLMSEGGWATWSALYVFILKSVVTCFLAPLRSNSTWHDNPTIKGPITGSPDLAGIGSAHGPFRGETRGNAVPIVKVFKNALLPAFRTIFSSKNAPHCRILHISEGNTPDAHRSIPDHWTQTPISAWLASVPIVPVFSAGKSNQLEYTL